MIDGFFLNLNQFWVGKGKIRKDKGREMNRKRRKEKKREEKKEKTHNQRAVVIKLAGVPFHYSYYHELILVIFISLSFALGKVPLFYCCC